VGGCQGKTRGSGRGGGESRIERRTSHTVNCRSPLVGEGTKMTVTVGEGHYESRRCLDVESRAPKKKSL